MDYDTDGNTSPWLSYEQAIELLTREFNVTLSIGGLQNKCYAGVIPMQRIADRPRIHIERLREWALADVTEDA